MGSDKQRALIFIILCLGIAGAVLHTRSPEKEVLPKMPLALTLAEVPGWSVVKEIPLDLEIVGSLDLDDYIFRTYSNGDAYVSLYIGLYRTSKKVGAAHSPLVCFPGQGWEISKPDAQRLETSSGTIDLAIMTVAKGMRRELLLYWFQAQSKTSSGTLMQKIYNFVENLNGGPTDNAFVRVSVPISEYDLEHQRLAASDFIRSFYPIFRNYIAAHSERD